MTTRTKLICRSIILVGILSIWVVGSAQERPLEMAVDKWADKLSKAETNEVNSLGRLTNLLIEADSLRAFRFLDSLESSKKAKGYTFRTFFCMVKADFLFAKYASYNKYRDRSSKELRPFKEQIMKLSSEALDAAYRWEKDLMIGWVCFYSARRMRGFGEIAWAVMYSKNGVDLFEKVKYAVEPPVYTELAELLHQVREYDESSMYARKGIAAWSTNNYEKEYSASYKFKIRAFNTIGRNFFSKNQYDSANFYFQQALQFAKDNNDSLLTGITLGNIGRVLYSQNKFDSAYRLLHTNYQNSMADSIYDNAASASEWAARANLAMGNKAMALAEAREAQQLLRVWPNGPFLLDTYQGLTQIFRAMGNYDSAFYYNARYIALNDSLEKEVVTSSLAISKTKINNEVSRYNIQKLRQEKRTQITLRNFIIAGIVLLTLLALLLLNRNRLKARMRMERMAREKELTEQEMAAALEQMKMFTSSISEKTNLIEKLEAQIKDKQNNAEQRSVIAELSQSTILTEADWTRFKLLFEKIHPEFFITLRSRFQGITVAEQRMAALIHLQLSTNDIAAMIGISPDSVHKSRQRLRQRLGIGSETRIEEVLTAL